MYHRIVARTDAWNCLNYQFNKLLRLVLLYNQTFLPIFRITLVYVKTRNCNLPGGVEIVTVVLIIFYIA